MALLIPEYVMSNPTTEIYCTRPTQLSLENQARAPRALTNNERARGLHYHRHQGRDMIKVWFLLQSFLSFRATAAFIPDVALTGRKPEATALQLTPVDQEIGTWTFAFASSHIGMSAVRRDIIRGCGEAADKSQLVNNDWRLPDLWPGDDDGGQAIFPTKEIAGRQLYRLLYTFVSFSTLGSAFFAYLDSLQQFPPQMMQDGGSIAFWISVMSWATSVTSLLNPSPLSLVPVFEAAGTDSNNNNDNKPGDMAVLQRNDKRKLSAYGMTRITRHPLILPVVPWGLATALSLGGQPRDFLLFGGLSLYAIAGCYAQDLRVSREEGSVGTVFNPADTLQNFFQETSFIPFQSVVDGRQSLSNIAREVPWWASVAGVAVGYQLQLFLLDWIVSQAANT